VTVGIFGGTFDPPHFGHLGVIDHALASGLVDAIWVVPCVAHAFGKQPAAFEHRLAMCRLLFGDRPGVMISDFERQLDHPGRTLELVTRLRAAHPDERFRLVAGADIWHERGKWHHYDEVAALAPPLYVSRRGLTDPPGPRLPAPPEISSTALREALAHGAAPVEWTSSQIIDYAREHRLYEGAR